MPSPGRQEITGLVLAGGRGARMGGADKGWVAYEGEPLVQHVLRRFAPQVGAVLISANRNLEAYRALADVVTDGDQDRAPEPFPGPLAGVLAGLQQAHGDWVSLAPCDAPALPLDLVARLGAAIGSADVACPVADGRRQPVFALIRRSSAASLRSFLQDGGRAMQGWFETLHTVDVPFDAPDGFRNINEPAVTPSRRSIE
ncbi:MAG: molybdenum cofactor guanylyltransferase MobA [Burkholderiaceae bacterium]